MQLTLSSFILGFFLFLWTGFPTLFSDHLRASFASILSTLQNPKHQPVYPQEISFLKLENYQLKETLSTLQDMQEGLARSKETLPLAAKVIYRDPTSWSSTIWINAGEEENEQRGNLVIATNSPVVDGNALIGVVDYVGKNQSRVRLITDSALCPAVRAVRGGRQAKEIHHLITLLKNRLAPQEAFASEIKVLSSIQDKLNLNTEDFYLAKGELKGSGLPFWKSRNPMLKGIGFNADFPDLLSPARELTSGRALSHPAPTMAIIQKGDLLVTSGLDGVFPSGLAVAIVEQVLPLPEGGYAYDIEATPAAACLNDLSIVFVLPPLSAE